MQLSCCCKRWVYSVKICISSSFWAHLYRKFNKTSPIRHAVFVEGWRGGNRRFTMPFRKEQHHLHSTWREDRMHCKIKSITLFSFMPLHCEMNQVDLINYLLNSNRTKKCEVVFKMMGFLTQ